jgi:hypothetical protein
MQPLTLDAEIIAGAPFPAGTAREEPVPAAVGALELTGCASGCGIYGSEF